MYLFVNLAQDLLPKSLLKSMYVSVIAGRFCSVALEFLVLYELQLIPFVQILSCFLIVMLFLCFFFFSSLAEVMFLGCLWDSLVTLLVQQ